MRKLLNKPWVVVLMAVVAIVLVAQSLLDRPQRRGGAAETVAWDSEALSPAEDRVAGSLAEALAGFAIPDQLPDPFAPRRVRTTETTAEAVDAGPAHTETVRLTAIWEQDGSIYILLNGRICGAGDTVGRITIASIEREGVWLTHWKGRDFVPLGQDFTLVTPAAAAAQPRNATHEG